MNSVSLVGKVSRVHQLKYTPAGTAVCEFTLAVSQNYIDKESIGYFEAIVVGELAEGLASLKIGKRVRIEGSLWTRTFKNRQGFKITDTKIFVQSIEE